ncbi:hypothetical protein QFC20_007541 [Naganishia adeliensis]|uniref:Uncharacterized protein n=1 Tax=Naganishia adeliensis TaxID=92952 RepID=A0ACC2UZB2_9TREE|nr:hypothetical protein QFC20_007541 [Naganishia adeliensis]
MQMASSPYEVPNSDPYAPPEDLPILLGCEVSHHDPNRPGRKGRKPLLRSDVFRTAGDHHESDDIVPDSDPPYPDWLPLIVPRGWPLSDGSNIETVETGCHQRQYQISTNPLGNIEVVKPSGEIPAESPDENNGMIENVETLLPWEPSKPIFRVFQYTHAASGGSGSEPRGVEHETEMDRILYGSPETRPGSAISIEQQGQEPTSEDERVWRDRLEMKMVQERADISLDAENGERDERGYCAGDRSSSPFEEAQRPS